MSPEYEKHEILRDSCQESDHGNGKPEEKLDQRGMVDPKVWFRKREMEINPVDNKSIKYFH